MASFYFVLALLSLYVSSSSADVDVTQYTSSVMADLENWHTFFPMRALEEEYSTNMAAMNATASMAANLKSSLFKVVEFQEREQNMAELTMNGTDASGCIKGISDFIPNLIDDVIDKYTDCTYDVISKLTRLRTSLNSLNSTYWTAYLRGKNGIAVCARTYPNKDSYTRLRSCVESMITNYFSAANSTQSSVFPSPSMRYFQSTVVECASNASLAVASAGWKFLDMLVDCAALSGNVDPQTYKQELSEWKGYSDTLAQEINASQTMNYFQIEAVEDRMKAYYRMQKATQEQYIIESRGFSYYLAKMYYFLNDYYNSVTSTSLDNPADGTCIDEARRTLDLLASQSATESLTCDQDITNKTKQSIDNVYGIFQTLNTLMPYTGNVVILQCMAQGYVFAPNTIRDCFQLFSTRFTITYTDSSVDIDKNVQVLQTYEASFYPGTDLHCGGTSLSELMLGADTALYFLQRCLYIASGTTYSVTTPVPSTTTDSSTTPGTTFSYISSTARPTDISIPTSTITRSTSTTHQPTTISTTPQPSSVSTTLQPITTSTTTQPSSVSTTLKPTITSTTPQTTCASTKPQTTTTSTTPQTTTTSTKSQPTNTSTTPQPTTTSTTPQPTTTSTTPQPTTTSTTPQPTTSSTTPQTTTTSTTPQPTTTSTTPQPTTTSTTPQPTTTSTTPQPTTTSTTHQPTTTSTTPQTTTTRITPQPTTTSTTPQPTTTSTTHQPTTTSTTPQTTTTSTTPQPTTASTTLQQ